MAKQRFNLNTPGTYNDSSAKEELAKIETQDYYNYQIIPYDDIETNNINDYPINDIEELADEIKKFGLLTPLGIIPNSDIDDPSFTGKRYRLYSGERRYTAIGLILKEDPNYPEFKKGIPCMLEKASIDPVNEEIKLILANKYRNIGEEFKRKKAARLIELYQKKQSLTGEKINVTKQVAKDLNIGERQVQRYTAVNDKLLPELKQAFEKSKFNLENAAIIANMDESMQKSIYDLLKLNDEITKDEIKQIKNESNLLKVKINKLENDVLIKQAETKKLEDSLSAKETAIQKAIEEKNYLTQYPNQKPSEENSNKEKLAFLEQQVILLKQEKENLKEEKQKTETAMEETKKAMNDLKENKDFFILNSLSNEEKKQIRDELQLNTLEKDIEKKLCDYQINYKSYVSKYQRKPDNQIFLKNIRTIFEKICL